MKPTDELERRIGQMNEPTGRNLDERVMADIRNAVAGSAKRPIWPVIKLAAAAAVIALAILLVATLRPQKPQPTKERRTILSVGEMLTAKHLNATYRAGGMQALDALCEEAAQRVDIKPKELTVNKLIAELNGT